VSVVVVRGVGVAGRVCVGSVPVERSGAKSTACNGSSERSTRRQTERVTPTLLQCVYTLTQTIVTDTGTETGGGRDKQISLLPRCTRLPILH
jgi:hypothetical protein